jgi:ankyrin repeat protein
MEKPLIEKGYDLEEIAKLGNWKDVEIRSLPKRAVNDIYYGVGCMKTNAIGVAAQSSTIDKIPKELFSKEGLTTPNESGETPIHFICSRANHQLAHLPKKYLTQELLLIKNKDLTTPLHYLAFHGNLLDLRDLIDNNQNQEVLSSNNLELLNSKNLCTLDFAIYSLKGTTSGLAYPPKDKNKRIKKIKEQIKYIIWNVKIDFLKSQLQLPKDTKFYDEKRALISAEIARRNVVKDITKNQSEFEL